MLRFFISAVVVAGVLAAAQPGFAGNRAVTAPDQAQAAGSASEQVAAPATASRSAAPELQAPASTLPGSNVTPVGFGWG